MRIGLRTRPGALFLALFVAALLVFLPLRLALGWFGLAEQGLTARRVTGSIWAGALDEARFGEIALGDLSAGVAPLPLLAGRARIDLSGRDDAAASRVAGALSVTRHGFGIDDATLTLPVGSAFAPVPVTMLSLDDVSVAFRDDGCVRAEGRVRATLAGAVAGQAMPAMLAGPVRCDGEALLLPLTGAGGGEGATLRIWPDGRYRAALTLQPGDPVAAGRLQASGFVATPQGLELAIEGRF